MAEDTITKESVEKKLADGETLTPEETKFVMNSPNEGPGVGMSNKADDDAPDIPESEHEDIDPEKKGEKGKEGKDKDAPAKTGDDGADTDKSGKDTSASKDDKPAKSDTGKDKEPEPKKPEPSAETVKEKIESELAKPEGQEDLTDFSDREKGPTQRQRNKPRPTLIRSSMS
jgi:hypothetical protein